jgi:hypothetical protein
VVLDAMVEGQFGESDVIRSCNSLWWGSGMGGCGKCERAKLPGWTQERRVAWERAQPRHETSGGGIGGQRSVDSDLGWLQGWRFREHGTCVAREADKWVLFGGGPLWH